MVAYTMVPSLGIIPRAPEVGPELLKQSLPRLAPLQQVT